MGKRQRIFLQSSDSDDPPPNPKRPDSSDASDSDASESNKSKKLPVLKKRARTVPMKLADFAYGHEYPATSSTETESYTRSSNSRSLSADIANISTQIETLEKRNFVTVTADVHCSGIGNGQSHGRGRGRGFSSRIGFAGGVSCVKDRGVGVGRDPSRVIPITAIPRSASPENASLITANPIAASSKKANSITASSITANPENASSPAVPKGNDHNGSSIIDDDISLDAIDGNNHLRHRANSGVTSKKTNKRTDEEADSEEDVGGESKKILKFMREMKREVKAEFTSLSERLAVLEYSVSKIRDSSFPKQPSCVPLRKVEDIDRFESISDSDYAAVVDFLGSLSYGELKARANIVLTEALNADISPAFTVKGKRGTRKLEGTRFCSALYAAVSKNVEPNQRPSWNSFLDAIRAALKSAKMRVYRAQKE